LWLKAGVEIGIGVKPIPFKYKEKLMKVNLYKCNDNRYKVDKTLSDEKTFNAFSNTDINVINPVLKIADSANSIDGYNILYIPLLKRFYFIENVTVIRTGLYLVQLHIDVLYTYREKIKQGRGQLGESEKLIKPYYNDLSAPMDARPKIKKLDFSYTFPENAQNVLVVVNDRGKTT
jgi:hypothetical protein